MWSATYDSTIGRFLQADAEPLAQVAPYAYALLNPLGCPIARAASRHRSRRRLGGSPPLATGAAVANPGIRVVVSPYAVDQELISWTWSARTSGRNVATLPTHIPAAYIANNVGVSVTARHVAGNRYQADVTVTWDPNGNIIFDASQPDEKSPS